MYTIRKHIAIPGITIVFALLATGLLMLLPQPAEATHLEEPGNVTVTPKPDALLVSWDRVPDENASGITTAYHVRYRVRSSQGEWNGDDALHFRTLDGHEGCNTSRCSFNLSNAHIQNINDNYSDGPYPLLVLGTAYDVQVSARGSASSSDPVHDHYADPVSAIFGAPFTPDAPATETSTAGLIVTWTRPGDNGADITGYSVQWKKSDEADWDPHQDSGLIPTLNATIANLEVDTLYDVRVRAQNSRGWSNWSAVVSGKGADPLPSVYFWTHTSLGLEISAHGLPHTRLYSVEIDPPLEYDSSVHLRIKPNPYPNESDATQGEDYTIELPNAPDTTTTKVLDLPAGAKEVFFRMGFDPDLETEGEESVFFELAPIEHAPYTLVDDSRAGRYMKLEVVILDNSRSPPADADPERGIDIQPQHVIVGATSSVRYTVKLTSRPDSDVTVKAYLDGPDGEPVNIGFVGAAIMVSPSSLTFDSSNWNMPQTFTVTPQDAALWLEDEIWHGLTSDDLDYDTNDWFQGSGIGPTHIEIQVAVGGL